MRNGAIDDIANLSRTEQKLVQRLAYYIKTDDIKNFEKLVASSLKQHSSVVNYMFYAMKFAKGATFAVGKTDAFSTKLRRYEAVINSAKQQITQTNPVLSAIAHKISGTHDK